MIIPNTDIIYIAKYIRSMGTKVDDLYVYNSGKIMTLSDLSIFNMMEDDKYFPIYISGIYSNIYSINGDDVFNINTNELIDEKVNAFLNRSYLQFINSEQSRCIYNKDDIDIPEFDDILRNIKSDTGSILYIFNTDIGPIPIGVIHNLLKLSKSDTFNVKIYDISENYVYVKITTYKSKLKKYMYTGFNLLKL